MTTFCLRASDNMIVPPSDHPSSRSRRALLARAAVLTGAWGLGIAPRHSSAQAVTDWIADVNAFVRELRARHVAPFELTPADRIEAAAEVVRQHALAGRSLLIPAAFQEMVGMVGDFHTNVNLPELNALRLPFMMRRYAEGWFVVRVAPRFESWLGRRIHTLGGISVDAFRAACRPLAAYPLQAEFDALFDRVLQASGSILQYVQLLVDGSIDIGWSTGLSKVLFVDRVPLNEAIPSIDEVAVKLRPQLVTERQVGRNYYVEALPDTRAVYFGYRRCTPDPTYTPTQFSSDLLATARQVNATRVIIDLRGNGGGDSSLLNTLISGISSDAALRQAQGYVLTDARTQSSALMNAFTLRNDGGARTVGEVPGTALNHLGEVRAVALPSGRTMFYSTRRFNLRPSDPRGRATPLTIDLPVLARWTDAQIGFDTVVESAALL